VPLAINGLIVRIVLDRSVAEPILNASRVESI
jgi:hypothetical protein